MHCAANGMNPTFFEDRCYNPGVGINRQEGYEWNRALGREVGYAEPGVSGAAVMSVVGGSVVGDGTSDLENMKCRPFWKFEFLVL